MAATYLGYVFDEEEFSRQWQTEPNPRFTALLESGAIVNDARIAGLLGSQGNRFTIPFYNILDVDEDPANFDGKTDIPVSVNTSDFQTGIAYGRLKGWTAESFASVLSGDNVMENIASQVGSYWNVRHQRTLVGILNAVFGITGDAQWESHVMDITATGGDAVTDANKLGITTVNDLITQANGDHKGAYVAAIMHSAVAQRAENLQILEFWKRNDANGIQRPMGVASLNGLTVIIDDSMPTAPSATAGETEYTTYLLGSGVIRYADGNLSPLTPSDVDFDPKKNGGQETLYTRVRRVYHPNGFSFTLDISSLGSPTDAQLFATSNWDLKFNAKAIAMARLITNG
jgi:hypothetical protein